MTPQQLATLKAAILADQELANLPMTSGGALVIAEAFNQPADPAFVVWRTVITKDEIYANGFNWVAIDDVAEPKWRVWQELFANAAGAMDPSKPNVRAGIIEVWKGNAVKLAVQAYVLEKCKRESTRVEQLLATGVGSTPNPATLSFEGALSADDVQQARELP